MPLATSRYPDRCCALDAMRDVGPGDGPLVPSWRLLCAPGRGRWRRAAFCRVTRQHLCLWCRRARLALPRGRIVRTFACAGRDSLCAFVRACHLTAIAADRSVCQLAAGSRQQAVCRGQLVDHRAAWHKQRIDPTAHARGDSEPRSVPRAVLRGPRRMVRRSPLLRARARPRR